MGVSEVLARLLPDDDSMVVVECRHCGRAVDPGTDTCPACGVDEVARYEIPE